MATNNKILIPLEGVESEHCALIVDNAMAKLKGVQAHRVELNNKIAVLQSDQPETLLEAVKTIRDIGYDVSTVKKSLPVLQMSCASCAVRVEKILKSQQGVIDASVNYANANVFVEFIPGIVTIESLRNTVQSNGYELLIDENGSNDESAEKKQQEKFAKLKKKTILALILSVPVALIGMFFMNLPFANEIMWILSTPFIVWFGRDFYVNAWKQSKHHSANMDTLVALSTGVAYIFSVFNTLFPHFWHVRGLHAHVYFEAATVIIAFILLGKLLEEKAKGNTSSAIRKLMGLQSKTVTIVHKDGHQMQIPIEKVAIGNIIVIKP
ncbi:MAG TPA: cation transporter, partial [Bacteroidales bacterium]|nr:cation transporter [Bacteroidales bacterium]